ncbi:MAG: ATP-binding cassette domain-containing protein [Promethearchaeota archaeon]
MESSKNQELIDNSPLLNSETNPIIEFSNFSFRYEKQQEFALKNINLSIHPGEIILLGGISGSGKSTLCNAISGRIPFSISGQMGGKLSLFQKSIWEYDQIEISQRVSYVFQNAEEQLVNFTVFDEIAFAAENFNLHSDEIKLRVQTVADALGITNLLKRSIYSLSSGEKQKTIIAANLVMSPEILLLDEPLAFLDKDGEILLRNLLEKLHKLNPSLTIIIIEHRLKPFYSLIDRILLLNNIGHLIFNGSLDEYKTYIKRGNKRYLRDDTTLLNNNGNKRGYKSSKLKDNKKIENLPIISIENISYQYPNSNEKIFSNFSLKIEKGEFLGIEGNNGSGKTTLLYIIAHMLEPTSGFLKFYGKTYDSIELDNFIPKMGFIFQNPENQLFGKTIREEILFAPRNFIQKKKKNRMNEEEKNQFEETILKKYLPLIGESRNKLNIFMNQNPFSLSWGQKRRLNLASIFSYSPELLLVDEPFIGQDAASIEIILEILHKFVENGKTVLIVSHDKELLQNNCSRILKISKPKEKIQIQKDLSYSLQNKEKVKEKEEEKRKRRKIKSAKKISRINLFLKQSVFSYQKENWIGQLNPVLKLSVLILSTFLLFYQKSIIILSLSYIILLIITKSAKISIKSLLRQIRWIIILSLIYIPLNTLFDANISQNDDILFYFFSEKFPVRRLALYYSIRTGLLIIIFISTAVIFTKTTSPKDLVYSLIQIGIPYRFAFAFMIGLRYIPLIEQESNTIEIAQKLRGAYIRKGMTVKEIYNHIIERITTLLISILRKTKITASTIEARGFGLYKTRTNLYKVKWALKDTLILISFILLCFLSILIRIRIFDWVFQIPSLFSIYRLIFF